MTRIRYQLICAVALYAPVTATFAIEYQAVENIAPVVLGYVPEPTALAILALTAPLLLRRRRR